MDENKEKIKEIDEPTDLNEELEEMGDIRIADDVIGIVASLACQEVPGVIGMAGGITDGLNSLLGKENASKGIRLKFDNNKNVTANVYVIVEYGYNIPEIALAIQEKVKEAIEEMTKFEVQFVDVHIEGVQRRKVVEFEKEIETDENMADIVNAQTMNAGATVATSFEAQLAMHREDQESLDFEKNKQLALWGNAEGQESYNKHFIDIPDSELSEEELQARYHYKPVKMQGVEDIEARHKSFFEED